MQFEGKLMDSTTEKVILTGVTWAQKDNHGVYSLISKYYLQNKR